MYRPQSAAHTRGVAGAEIVVGDVLDHGVDVVHHVDVQAPVGRGHLGHVVQVEHSGVRVEVDVHVLHQRDDVVDVLLVQVHDLQLAEEEVGRVDGVGVDRQPVAEVDLVVHAHGVEEDVDVVAGRDLGVHGEAVADRGRPGAGRGARRRAGQEELQLPVACGHGDVAVLDVPEPAEDLADHDHLALEPDQVDVAVLTLRELEVDGVVPHGQPAGEAQDDVSPGAGVDDRVRLRHEALVPSERGVERRVVQAGGGTSVHVAARGVRPRPPAP